MSLIKKGEVPEDIKAKLKELFSNPIINKTLSKKNMDRQSWLYMEFVKKFFPTNLELDYELEENMVT